LSSGEGEFFCRFVLVGRAGAEHGVQDVDAAAGEADEGGVVFLALSAFPVVASPAEWVGKGGERGQEERAFELLVAALGWVLAVDAGARASGDRGQSGVGGQVAGGGEGGEVADFEQDPGCASSISST
jgi:hypothetical protein